MALVNNQGRTSRWQRAQNHSLKFISWFQDKVKSENVEHHLFWLAKDPNPIVRRHTGYFVNGYRFYTKNRDSRLKTQNSGVTLTALTSSFASSKDKNPILGDVTYYGAIEDIIEVDFWSKFSVVLFRCDWYHADVDDLGLTRVHFKKLRYKDDPYVLASQVHQVFYVPDSVENDIYYAMKRILRDLFDFPEAETPELYWNEPLDVSYNAPYTCRGDDYHSREDVNVRIVDISEILENDQNMDQAMDDSDYDDTDWDWMHCTT